MTLDPPLYPHRDIVFAGQCGKQPLDDLRRWVQGASFHRYAEHAYTLPTIEEGLRRAREHPGILKFEGKISTHGSGLDWSVRYQQAGDPDAWGMTSPHMTPEDAAYTALTMIEDHDREVYEQNLVVGTA